MFRKKNKGRSGSSFALGALIGGVLGGAAALLLTPKTGEEMREEIADHCRKLSDETVELMDAVSEHSTEIIEKAKEIANEAKEAAEKYLER